MAGLSYEPASLLGSGGDLTSAEPRAVPAFGSLHAPPGTLFDLGASAGATQPAEADAQGAGTASQHAEPVGAVLAEATPVPLCADALPLRWLRTARRSATARRAREVRSRHLPELRPRHVQVLPAWVQSHREWGEACQRCSPPLPSFDRFKRLMLAANDLLLSLGESLAPQSLGLRRFVGDSAAAKDRLTIALLVEDQERVLCAVSASGDVGGRVEQLLAVATAQSARKQGCLRRVLDRLFVVLAERGVQRVCVGTTADNVDAGLAYQRLGFVAVPRPPVDCVYRLTASNVTLTWVRELDTSLALPRPPAVWKPAMYDNPPELPDSSRRRKRKAAPVDGVAGCKEE